MQKIISYRGVRLNQRTIDMIEAAERILGFKLRLTQGSYNAGKVEASAGTHDGGGAVDIALKDAQTGALFPKVRRERIRAATRQVGFASWIRDPSQSNWPWHLHAIAIGDPDLSSGARAQVTAYRNGLNGLASVGKDDGPRTWVGTTWEQYLKAHPPTTEDDMTPEQYAGLIQEQKTQGDATRQEVRRQAIWGLTYTVEIADNLCAAADRFAATIKAGFTVEQAQAAFAASVAGIRADLKKRSEDNG